MKHEIEHINNHDCRNKIISQTTARFPANETIRNHCRSNDVVYSLGDAKMAVGGMTKWKPTKTLSTLNDPPLL